MHKWVRSLAWRAGRKLYCWAREDLANDAYQNGEYWLLEHAIKHCSGKGILLDVGAHMGRWSLQALATAESVHRQINIIAFEPSTPTRDMLRERLAGKERVEVCQFALSSVGGVADFYSDCELSGTNSLNAASGPSMERVQVTTLDSFFEQRDIDQVLMAKIDAEGYDFSVLEGATNVLAGGRIELLQFEYNWRWLLNRASLRDVFNLIKKTPYRIGKLTGDSIVLLEHWHFEMDRYFENNYLLVRMGSELEQFARIGRFDEHNVLVAPGRN